MRADLQVDLVYHIGSHLIDRDEAVLVPPDAHWPAYLAVDKTGRGDVLKASHPMDGQWSHPQGEIHLVALCQMFRRFVDLHQDRRRGDRGHGGRAAMKIGHGLYRRIDAKTTLKSHLPTAFRTAASSVGKRKV